ncbi:MAG: hypothetical protein ACUVXD_01705 [Thermodesulfobacteriota bacterium]
MEIRLRSEVGSPTSDKRRLTDDSDGLRKIRTSTIADLTLL